MNEPIGMASTNSPVIICKAYTTDLVAVVQDASQHDSTPVILWPYSDAEAQFTPWVLGELDDGSYVIIPTTSATDPLGCLDVNGGSTADGAKVMQHTQNRPPSTSQKWVVSPRADGFVAFVGVKSGKCLTAYNGPIQNLQLTLYPRDDTNHDQAWALAF